MNHTSAALAKAPPPIETLEKATADLTDFVSLFESLADSLVGCPTQPSNPKPISTSPVPLIVRIADVTAELERINGNLRDLHRMIRNRL